jgi:molecular chaperone GrpE
MEENDKYERRVPRTDGTDGNGDDDGGRGDSPKDSPDAVTTEQASSRPEQEIEALKKERDELYDRLLRKQAEFENYKKRTDREKSEFTQFASADLMKELLNALDSFELALKNAAGEAGGQNMLRGFELIYKQIQDTLARFGLKPIEAKGKKFDPHFHQAVATQPTDQAEENTVLEEMRKGYLLNGRLLRAAMVSVAAKKD